MLSHVSFALFVHQWGKQKSHYRFFLPLSLSTETSSWHMAQLLGSSLWLAYRNLRISIDWKLGNVSKAGRNFSHFISILFYFFYLFCLLITLTAAIYINISLPIVSRTVFHEHTNMFVCAHIEAFFLSLTWMHDAER